jgi:hypothetical protein
MGGCSYSHAPLYWRLSGTKGCTGQVRKISLPLGLEPRTFQLEASRYTDWAIPAPLTRIKTNKIFNSIVIFCGLFHVFVSMSDYSLATTRAIIRFPETHHKANFAQVVVEQMLKYKFVQPFAGRQMPGASLPWHLMAVASDTRVFSAWFREPYGTTCSSGKSEHLYIRGHIHYCVK